ncbi:MAG: LPS export ABC transporter periplasmic protein LptC [Lysobacterales bacterium]
MTPERSRLWAVVLLLTTVASYGLIRWFAPEPPPAPATATARQDNEIRTVEMRVYDEQGKPNLVLISPRISSPRRSDEYLIESPLFDVVSADGARWNGKSLTGRLDVARNRLWLEQQVVLEGTKAERAPVTIRSEHIEFGIDERVASSDDAVEIISPGSEIKGVGLRADLKQDRFLLRSQVEGEYVPKRKRS